MTKLDVGQNIKGDFVDKNYESLDERVLTCTDGPHFGLQVPSDGQCNEEQFRTVYPVMKAVES